MHLQYGEVRQAHFLERPNRFIAHVELEGETVVCHVKNTGRCRELLVRGATVYLERGTNPARRTAWDLIAVEKGHRLINMDAQAPNRIFAQWIHQQEPEITVHPEYRYGDSRLDFCLERPEGLHLVEVKGVTLEREGHCLFPDAPTERGVRHLHELMRAVEEGHRATAFFVIQMADVLDFAPNDTTPWRGGGGLHLPGDAGDGDAGRPRAGAAVTGYAIPLRRRCVYTMYQERMMLYEHETYPEGVRFLTLPIYLGGNHHEQDHSHPGGRDPGGGGALLAGATRLSRTGRFPRPGGGGPGIFSGRQPIPGRRTADP